jgi:hypothetical protein
MGQCEIRHCALMSFHGPVQSQLIFAETHRRRPAQFTWPFFGQVSRAGE